VVELSTTTVALLAAVITAFYQTLSLSSNLYQQRLNRKAEFLIDRRKAYERYLTSYSVYNSLYDFDPPSANNSKERIEAVREYWYAYSGLFPLASDPVLEAVTNFHKLAWMIDTELAAVTYVTYDEASDKEYTDLLATMIIEMRRDVLEHALLDRKSISSGLRAGMLPRRPGSLQPSLFDG
jgi:hypothetical protein